MNAREAIFTCVKGEEELMFRRMEVREDMGRPYVYRLELLRESVKNAKSPINGQDLVGTRATVQLSCADNNLRYFNGWISACEQGGIYRHYDVYRLEMRPWLWYLSLDSDSRIFQNKKTLDIIESVFGEYKFQSLKKELTTGGQRVREYCVQYRESDLDFVSRLMEEDGLYYYFEHTADGHTLVLCDGTQPHPAVPHVTQFLWAAESRQDRYLDTVLLQLRTTSSLQPLKFRHSDYNYLKPTLPPEGEATRTNPGESAGALEVAYWPGEFCEPDNSDSLNQGTPLAEVQINAWNSEALVATAVTPCRNVGAGGRFTFKRGNVSTEYTITGTSMDLDFGDYESTTVEASRGFSCRMSMIPSKQKFASQRLTVRPRVPGPQTALVVGTDGEEITTDAHGRIKVKFHWDRAQAKDASCSCWLRVATPWASKGFGMIGLPRIGDEVVVDFLEGNADRPLVVGSVYNQDNVPPYPLPDQATVSGIRTRSSKGGDSSTFNELRFDDKRGSEYVWLQAQKDFHRLVKNDEFDTVQGAQWHAVTKQAKHHYQDDLHTQIDKKSLIKIGEDTSVHIGGDLNVKLDGGWSAAVTKALQLSITQGAHASAQSLDLSTQQGIKVADELQISLKAASVVLEAQTSLSLKVGGSFITLSPDGVSITGVMVKINSGGSASSASSPSAPSPASPEDPVADQANTDPLAGG